MSFAVVDWCIILGFVSLLIIVVLLANRHTSSVSDFVAANRSAGRYLLAIASGAAAMGITTIIGNWELYYHAGFSALWWGFLIAPICFILSSSGFVIYRYRQTRALTMAQFFEMRYSRKFRVFAGILSWSSGMLNYGIFPAVTSRCLIYICGIPVHTAEIFGLTINLTMAVVMFITLSLAVFFAIMGGQIAVIITDFIQGQLLTIVFAIIIAFLYFKLEWGHIIETLKNVPQEQSMLNPFAQGDLKDFNIWFFIIQTVLVAYGWMAWQGNQMYMGCARSPHEARMANILGYWRGFLIVLLNVFIPVCVYVIMKSPNHLGISESVDSVLTTIGEDKLRGQILIPATLTTILPHGLVGLMAAALFAVSLSTDDTYLHAWGTIFVQDVVVPLRKKKLNEKEHIKLLRLGIVGAAAFAWFFSMIFPLKEYLFMYCQITGSIYLGGAGAAILGGLYWKRGTSAGAWVGMITGSVCAVASILLKNVFWPLLESFKTTHPEISWLENLPSDLPLNGMQLSFICSMIAMTGYVIVSLMTKPDPDFNMDQMLHRGKYRIKDDHQEVRESTGLMKRLGITDEFTFSDKFIYFASYLVTFTLFIIAIVGTIFYKKIAPTEDDWGKWWCIYLIFVSIITFIVLIWMINGGIRDILRLFKDLKAAKRDIDDDGTVIRHHNLCDKEIVEEDCLD